MKRTSPDILMCIQLRVADGTAMIIGPQGLRDRAGGRGHRCIAHTYIATAAAIKLAGAEPVFADIGDDYMMARAISGVPGYRTDESHHTDPAERQMLQHGRDFCARLVHGLMVLEDSAQGLGTPVSRARTGTFGRFGTLSFYPAKLMGCFGDGGAVMTNEPEIARQLSLLRDHGRDEDGLWLTGARTPGWTTCKPRFSTSGSPPIRKTSTAT